MFFGGHRSSDNTRFYSLLELDQNASTAEIKKAYRRLVVKHHPDKGGDADKFKEITRAYEVLSDPEKRETYDRLGEEGLEEGAIPAASPSNIFDLFFGGGQRTRRQQRPRTENVTHKLSVTLEQLYNGQVRKMALTRNVIDNEHGVQTCADCKGQGTKVRVIRRGNMIQQMQTTCEACGGQGKAFRLRSERQVMEVHVQKGAPENHRIVCKEMADEHPDADTGDVIFTLVEKEHPVFKRKGADLFVERDIALVEALCGFSLEIQHLDGRKLLIQTKPGEIIKPTSHGFDPFSVDKAVTEWEIHTDVDCPSIPDVAQAQTDDVSALKTACETQLKSQGINASAFVIKRGRAFFKTGTREEIIAKSQRSAGATMYVVKDPASGSNLRMMKAVRGEGMPTFKEPFRHGNLFLVLNIQFPESLSEESQTAIRQHLPPPVNLTLLHEDDEDVELHTVEDIDPLQSYTTNKVYMEESRDAYEEEDSHGSQQPWSRL